MSYLVNYSKWKAIFEAGDESSDSISDVRSKAMYTGSTPSKTSNASALEQFKNVLSPVGGTVTGEPIDDTKAIFRSTAVKSSKSYTIGPKTVQAKNYIKIGDKIANGDSGKPIRIEITAEDLTSNTVEASGNGIYALGRALELKYKHKFLGESPIIIELNKPTPDSVVANADTAFQTPVGDFNVSALFTFIVSKAIIPNPNNKSANVISAISARDKGTVDANKYVSDNAMPHIATAAQESLKSVSAFDATSFVKTIQNKQIKQWDSTLDGLVNQFTDSFFEPFLNAYSERFKQYYRNLLTSAKANPELFNSLYSYIDEWKTKEISNKEKYKTSTAEYIKSALNIAAETGSVTKAIASGTSQSVKGTEGKLGN